MESNPDQLIPDWLKNASVRAHWTDWFHHHHFLFMTLLQFVGQPHLITAKNCKRPADGCLLCLYFQAASLSPCLPSTLLFHHHVRTVTHDLLSLSLSSPIFLSSLCHFSPLFASSFYFPSRALCFLSLCMLVWQSLLQWGYWIFDEATIGSGRHYIIRMKERERETERFCLQGVVFSLL